MAIFLGADIDQVYTSLEEGKTPALGDVYFASGNKIYKFVTYSEEAAAVDGVAGEVAYYVADTGYSAHDVTSDLSASSEIGAGVLVSNMSDNEYGWIQIKGAATLTINLTAGADGDPLSPTGSADGTLDTVEAVAAMGPHVCAIAVDASADEIICDFPF
jgi:hypothetical protein